MVISQEKKSREEEDDRKQRGFVQCELAICTVDHWGSHFP